MQRYIDELQLLHAIRMAVVATDPGGHLTFVNEAAADLYGGTSEELIGRRFTEFLTDAGAAELAEANLRRVMRGELWRGDVSLQRLDGENFLAGIVATPLFDGDREPIGVVVVSEDITDLRIAEAERQAADQRLRLALRAARLGTWHWDIAAGTNVWDERLEEIYGLPPGGFGGSFEAWMASIHPEDVPEVLDRVNAAMADPSPYLLKNRVVWPDGTTVRWIEAWGEVTTDDAGRPSGTIGCVRDVTEEVETQQALAAALAAERQAAWRSRLLLEMTADLATATSTVEVEQALAFQLEELRTALDGRADLAMPPSVLDLRSGRDLVTGGYDDLDLADQTLLDGLAAQSRLAAQRADLMASTSALAEDLQLSLAASPLPLADDLELAVHYAPGGSELEHVGGDWYDAVRTGDGQLAVVVGDVMGRGVRAATTMIRVRAGIRGLITVDPQPDHLLAFADDVMARDAPDQFVTAAAALIDPATRRLRLALAGHVPVLAVLPDGTSKLLGVDSGIPLGVQTGVARTTEDHDLPAGTVLVLVTDGVVESRESDLEEGIERFRACATDLRDGPLSTLVGQVAALADSSMRDDVTVFAVRVR